MWEVLTGPACEGVWLLMSVPLTLIGIVALLPRFGADD